MGVNGLPTEWSFEKTYHVSRFTGGTGKDEDSLGAFTTAVLEVVASAGATKTTAEATSQTTATAETTSEATAELADLNIASRKGAGNTGHEREKRELHIEDLKKNCVAPGRTREQMVEKERLRKKECLSCVRDGLG